MKKLTTEKSGKREKSLVAHCSPSTANLRPTLTTEERFDKMCLRAIRTNPDFFVNVEMIRKFMVKELKANDDAWRERIEGLIEKNKAYDFGIYDYEGIALDLINLLKEKTNEK